MYPAQIHATKETPDGTWLTVLIPRESKTDEIKRLTGDEGYLTGSIYFDDGRYISSKQQRAIFALIRDISSWWADDAEFTRKYFQEEFCFTYDIEPFSLSHSRGNCVSVTIARNFITFLLEECLKHSIPLKEGGLTLTDDTDKYLYLCLKYRKCCVTGKDGEVHHWDVIGMGRNRKHYDDSEHRKICLCREMHDEAHIIGRETFAAKYHVYGIKYEEQ